MVRRLESPGRMTLHASLIHLVFLAALACLSAAVVRGMIALGVMDHPEGRKAHEAPTPKMGGVGIVLAYLLGIAILYRFADFARLADPYFRGMIMSACAIAFVALLDDLTTTPSSSSSRRRSSRPWPPSAAASTSRSTTCLT